MKKMLFSAIAMVAFAGSVSASNEIKESKEIDEARNYCDLKFSNIDSDGTIVIEIRRAWGYNLDCEKEQA